MDAGNKRPWGLVVNKSKLICQKYREGGERSRYVWSSQQVANIKFKFQ
jgi:hypothetical protein